MKNQYETLINKSEELTGLLKELQISSEAEQHRYVIKFECKQGSDDIYSLYDNVTKKVMLDKMERIESWLRLRNISPDLVYQVKL